MAPAPAPETLYMPSGSIDISKWWRYKNLRTLNFLLLIPLLSLFATGYVRFLPLLPSPLHLYKEALLTEGVSP